MTEGLKSKGWILKALPAKKISKKEVLVGGMRWNSDSAYSFTGMITEK